MTLADYYTRQIPDYYDTMYLDGYSPEQILFAAHRKMYQDYEERKEAEEESLPYNLKITSEVKVK